MQSALLDSLAAAEATYWWHVGRMRIVSGQLRTLLPAADRPREILNIGSGTGGTIPALARFGHVVNADVSTDAIAHVRRKGYDAVQLDGGPLPFADKSFDVVVALDVIEHIEDEAGALAEWRRVLADDGTLLLAVPAYQWLWSDFDVFNGHFRRYTRTRLAAAVRAADFSVVRSSYMIVGTLPLVAGYRLLSRVWPSRGEPQVEGSFVPVPQVVNSALVGLLRAEAFLARRVRFPFGSSVILSARKR